MDQEGQFWMQVAWESVTIHQDREPQGASRG